MSLWIAVLLAIIIALIAITLPLALIVWVVVKSPDPVTWAYKLAHKLAIIIGASLAIVLYRVLNRTEVYGNIEEFRETVKKNGAVICANHLSAWDSFCLGVALFPGLVRHPSRTPVHSPKYRAELKSTTSQNFLRLLRCVFIDVNNPRQVIGEWKPQVLQYLRNGISTILFGEGTRHPGPNFHELGQWKRADGLLIEGTDIACVPVGIRGTEDVLPRDAWLPRIGKRIVIVVGKPMRFKPTASKKTISEKVGPAVQKQLTKASVLYDAPHPSRLFQVLQYCCVVISGIACWFFFTVFNHTIVIGKNRLNHKRNTLIIPSHGTMIDSWPIEFAMIWPEFLQRPWLMTAHTPELNNYGRNPFVRLLCLLSNAIHVERGNNGNDFIAKLPAIAARMLRGQLMVFHDGGRNAELDASTQLRRRKPSAGIIRLIKSHRPDWIVPVGMIGMQSVLKPYTRIPKVGKLIVVVFGEPINTADFSDDADGHEALTKKITGDINQLLDEANQRHQDAQFINPFRRLLDYCGITFS